MPGEEKSDVVEDVVEAPDEFLLSGFIEIDHNVAAEDKIEGAIERPGFHEVEVGEADDVSERL